MQPIFKPTATIYKNALNSAADIQDWQMEGGGVATFPRGRMRLESVRGAEEGQAANVVFWCPQVFPDNIEISWNFLPLYEPGLCILFFAATGKNGENVLDVQLEPRTGLYGQYHHGDINALHVSYFRRRFTGQGQDLHLCNLRKSYGFHMVKQGPDPIPSVDKAASFNKALNPYHIKLQKFGGDVAFFINDVPIFQWSDDGESYGPILRGGQIGFRQMAPMIAEYSHLEIKLLEDD